MNPIKVLIEIKIHSNIQKKDLLCKERIHLKIYETQDINTGIC